MKTKIQTLLFLSLLTACADAGGAEPSDGADEPRVLEVNGGVKVTGVGDKQQWEGVVMTQGGRGLCTAAFITDRHLISASHCYAGNGTVSLKVSAPTWDNGAQHTFQANVKRSGASQTLDISIIDLGKAVEWATPERRFVLNASKPTGPLTLNLYGFGSGGSSGGAGTFRGMPDRQTLTVTADSKGNLNGKSTKSGLCTGDSGGPAFIEGTAPVLAGINQAIIPTAGATSRTCASAGWSMMFTNVANYLDFIEQSIGKKCERKQVDGREVASCG